MSDVEKAALLHATQHEVKLDLNIVEERCWRFMEGARWLFEEAEKIEENINGHYFVNIEILRTFFTELPELEKK